MSDLSEIKSLIEAQNVKFEEFKKTNEAKLEAIKKEGATGDFEAKLKAIADDMAKDRADQKKAMDELEAKAARPKLGGDGKPWTNNPKPTRRPSAATCARASSSTSPSSRRP
jgi:predicted phage gp36 major capsid-like protein